MVVLGELVKGYMGFDEIMAMSLTKRCKLVYRTSFAAAHRIEDYPGKCSSIHGHTYLVEVMVEGSLDNLNMVIDVEALKRIVEEVVSLLDHRYVNEVLNERNVTMELLASWILAELSHRLPSGVSIIRVSVCESEKACAIVEI